MPRLLRYVWYVLFLSIGRRGVDIVDIGSPLVGVVSEVILHPHIVAVPSSHRQDGEGVDGGCVVISHRRADAAVNLQNTRCHPQTSS